MTSTHNISLRQFRCLCIIAAGLPAYHDIHTNNDRTHRRQSFMSLITAGLIEEVRGADYRECYRFTEHGREFYNAVAADISALFRGEPAIAPAVARGGARHQPPPGAALSNQTTSFQTWMEKVASGYSWELVRAEFDCLHFQFNSGISVPAARLILKQAAELQGSTAANAPS